MRYRLSDHARRRMRQRGVTESDLDEALDHQVTSWDDPNKGSIVITGRTASNRVLKIFVAGSLPAQEPYRIKSLAWRDES